MSKTAKVALVNPPTMKGVFHHHPYLPIGLAYLAAVLEEKGNEVLVLDCLASDIDHEHLKQKLAAFNPNVDWHKLYDAYGAFNYVGGEKERKKPAQTQPWFWAVHMRLLWIKKSLPRTICS